MSFPLDPNAPGGPRRSEYVSSHYVTAREPATDPPADAEVAADPQYRTSGIAGLRHLRRLEVRIATSPCGA
jgi:hypothetical protein